MVIALVDLLEAEGRELRRNVARMGQGLAMIIVAAVLAAGGAGMVLWALYQSMAMAMGPSLGALITGVIGLLCAGVMLWIAHLITR